MNNYVDPLTDATPWNRAARIVIENGYGGVPAVTVVEERAYHMDGDVITKSLGNLVEPFITSGDNVNIMEQFELVNPIDNTPLGQQMTYAQVHVLLHSLYIHLAQKRDSIQNIPQE